MPGRRKINRISLAIALFTLFSFTGFAQNNRAKWIGASLDKQDSVNVWSAFKKQFTLRELPESALARIAVDSKYWLYINGKLVVFEGGLKRGPNPIDTYYDEINVLPYLKKGENHVAVLVWYYGKQGFSHKSSGKAGLFFDLTTEAFSLKSDSTWQAKRLKAYQTAGAPQPNFRLPESSILYDARIADPEWYSTDVYDQGYAPALVFGDEGESPWNKLIKRPIPLFKDFGLKNIPDSSRQQRGDTLICKLPYNMQFTPYIALEAPSGKKIKLVTDNYLFYNGSDENIRAEYITKEGDQSYESLGWINGHYLYIIVPKDVKIKEVKYRETGYSTEFSSSFSSDDPFFNALWEKARRTLYITMRDSYMDCPDRERAQWTGDAVLEAEEAFYALDTNAHALARKWLYELINWQRADGSLFAPVPAGNWNKELPDQVLATIGYYGLWTYYRHTGDKQILTDLYPHTQRYLKLWKKYPDGLVKLRAGGWQWGDWGNNKDMLLLYNLWYYLALKGHFLMANELGKVEDANKYKKEMTAFATAFNKRFWSKGEYRNPAYKGKTDDRVHALAVLADIAGPDQYPAIQKVFAVQEHASPYMEKYVFEAMFKMGLPTEALARQEKRFGAMVNNPDFTTLFEGWGIGTDGFGGGTVNHAWSGGGLSILSSKLCGIEPLSPGYKTILVHPQMGYIHRAEATVSSVKGLIKVKLEKHSNDLLINLSVPKGTKAKLLLPKGEGKELWVNHDALVHNGVPDSTYAKAYHYKQQDQSLWLSEGEWQINSGISFR